MARQTLHARLQGFVAIILWLTTIAHLSPLPPDEVAYYVEHFERNLAQPPMSLPNWDLRPEWEKKRTEESWNNTAQKMRSFIAEKGEQEVMLWIKW